MTRMANDVLFSSLYAFTCAATACQTRSSTFSNIRIRMWFLIGNLNYFYLQIFVNIEFFYQKIVKRIHFSRMQNRFDNFHLKILFVSVQTGNHHSPNFSTRFAV